jgi:enamine deaminase RidA (YjgF/YER057c/UK114 family)
VYVDSALPFDLLSKLLQELLPSETAVTVVPTAALPGGSHIELAGIAGKNAKRVGSCTALGTTFYCEGRSSTTAEVLARLKTDLDAAKTNMSRVVAANVYIDDIDNFAAMNKLYAGAFSVPPPTRTTVQPLARKEAKGNSISLIAVQ